MISKYSTLQYSRIQQLIAFEKIVCVLSISTKSFLKNEYHLYSRLEIFQNDLSIKNA